MPLQDAATTRLVRREITRRRIDDAMLQINAMHGIVYIRGEIHSLAGYTCDLHQEMNIIVRILKTRPGIRDVILEIIYPS